MDQARSEFLEAKRTYIDSRNVSRAGSIYASLLDTKGMFLETEAIWKELLQRQHDPYVNQWLTDRLASNDIAVIHTIKTLKPPQRIESWKSLVAQAKTSGNHKMAFKAIDELILQFKKDGMENQTFLWCNEGIEQASIVLHSSPQSLLSNLAMQTRLKCRLRLGQAEAGIREAEQYKEEIRHQPNLLLDALDLIGSVYRESGNHDLALDTFQEMHQLSSNLHFSSRASLGTGRTYFQMAKISNAIQHFEAVLTLLEDDNSPEANSYKRKACLGLIESNKMWYRYSRIKPLLEQIKNLLPPPPPLAARSHN